MGLIYDDFRARHVIVTGAANGIGRAIAIAYAEQGARVTAIDIDETGLNETANATSGSITGLVCDIRDIDSLRESADRAISDRGSVRVLVNNAGVDRRIPLAEIDAETWREMMAINLDCHAVLSVHLADLMDLGDGHAAIVNLSSTAWMKLAGNLAAYHAAKAGIVGLTRGLARDLGVYGITANVIAPGRVVTERVAKSKGAEWEAETKTLQCVREFIAPRDIADAALFLSSRSARFITGQTLVVDGGVV